MWRSLPTFCGKKGFSLFLSLAEQRRKCPTNIREKKNCEKLIFWAFFSCLICRGQGGSVEKRQLSQHHDAGQSHGRVGHPLQL
jgi:hypothetical protein